MIFESWGIIGIAYNDKLDIIPFFTRFCALWIISINKDLIIRSVRRQLGPLSTDIRYIGSKRRAPVRDNR